MQLYTDGISTIFSIRSWWSFGYCAVNGSNRCGTACALRRRFKIKFRSYGLLFSCSYNDFNSQEGASTCFAIFLPTLVMGNFMVLNLFLALLLNSFNSEELKSKKEVNCLRSWFCVWHLYFVPNTLCGFKLMCGIVCATIFKPKASKNYSELFVCVFIMT